MQALVSKESSEELNQIQQYFFSQNIPVLIVFEGCSGRVIHRVINEVLRCLEPRGVSYHHFDPRVNGPKISFEYLKATPEKGAFSLFDRSWYAAMVDRFKGDDDEIRKMAEACDLLEKYLTDNGIFVIKIMLDASPEIIKKYGDDYAPPPCVENTFLSVDKIDPMKFKSNMSGRMFKETDTEHAPWDLIQVGQVESTVNEVVDVIKKRLLDREQNGVYKTKALRVEKCPNPRNGLVLDRKCPNYDEMLEKYSDDLYELQALLAGSNRSLVIGFEGWDAAGKGSAIKHLTHALNPRGYSVRQIKKPTEEELSHPYLWRFCDSMPEIGHITIFDRTWYGRMMVEPIEGLCTKEEYDRAPGEINAMEAAMVKDGMILLKFWLDISSDEQLQRFNKRAESDIKKWKLTDEDWRNRDKWEVYDKYVNRVMEYTNTADAPWTVIPANNKKFARVMVLKTVADALRRELIENMLSKLM
ncbi:MAG: hypothetical protein WCQ23_07150 [Candidatus Methanomethylophilaceae archaeon]